jgi:hypothetical protein
MAGCVVIRGVRDDKVKGWRRCLIDLLAFYPT